MAQLKSTSINGNLIVNGDAYFNGSCYYGNSTLTRYGDDFSMGDMGIAGCMCIYGRNGDPGIFFYNHSGFIQNDDGQHLKFGAGPETQYRMVLGVVDNCWALYPETNNYLGLGGSNHVWGHIFIRDNPYITSDERKKNILGSIDEKYFTFFDKTEPIKYTLKDEANDKIRLGLGAQSVEKALLSSGISLNEYSGLNHYIDENSDSYFLDYNSYFMIAAAQTKKNKEKIIELEKRIEKLESK